MPLLVGRYRARSLLMHHRVVQRDLAFFEIANNEDAEKVIATVNGTTVMDRRVRNQTGLAEALTDWMAGDLEETEYVEKQQTEQSVSDSEIIRSLTGDE